MKRIQLSNTEFEGNNNVYLLDTEDEVGLIDTGVYNRPTIDEFEQGLSQHGLSPGDIDHVFLTHWHADHVGLAGFVQERSGASVYVHEEDAPLVRQDDEAWEEMSEKQERLFNEWGMPEEKRERLLNFFEGSAPLRGEPPMVETFVEGDTFGLGGVTLEVLHVPGHTAGLSCFLVDGINEENEAFVGDSLLPVYTPNVGGADVRVEKPLKKYLNTLHRIADLDLDRVWPGHRYPILDPTERAHEIIDHHWERSSRVVDVLERHGPSDAWTVSAHLFGELENIHILHGPGEAYAHLEHLSDNGIVKSVSGGYTTSSNASEKLAELMF
ncbi:MAG: MBL fold metallo-hydrolase [Halobacteria archaeon]|nr:MBL fold metallo-hydrolase [Halobacteria archaeon]